MTAALATAVALVFVWLGMVLAISFLEAPLKFRAPNLSLAVGLGIGRIVFRALNAVEVVLAVAIAALVLTDRPGERATIAIAVAIVLLAVQLLAVRPALTRRSDRVLAGHTTGERRSHAHLYYVGLEAAKVAALVIAGVTLLSG